MKMALDLTKSNPVANLNLIVVSLQLFPSGTPDSLIPSRGGGGPG
ncbi:MAG: hypothetical protein AAF649_13105 [Verrucomicrobiota bacterium]